MLLVLCVLLLRQEKCHSNEVGRRMRILNISFTPPKITHANEAPVLHASHAVVHFPAVNPFAAYGSHAQLVAFKAWQQAQATGNNNRDVDNACSNATISMEINTATSLQQTTDFRGLSVFVNIINKTDLSKNIYPLGGSTMTDHDHPK